MWTDSKNGKNAQDVLNRAEKGLQESEGKGGNRYTYYIPGEDELAEQERNALLSKQVKHALKSNLLHLMFQPIVSLKGDENKNYEVLIRMQDDSGAAHFQNRRLLIEHSEWIGG